MKNPECKIDSTCRNYATLSNLPKNVFIFLICIGFSLFNFTTAIGQGIIPTKGTDFWVGFPKQYSSSHPSKRLEVFITSDVNTNGTISIPLQGYSVTFNVIANQTTTLTVPLNLAEHTSSQLIDNKGVQILTADTVSVFAISFETYTSDACVVYPKQSLGTEYRIASYQGLSSLPSQFLVVATEDDTQIIITPTATTMSGSPAGVPFTVNLNAGQSYQVRASTASGDFTGTVIQATDSSGSCRPFAVFSGATCVNIPAGCWACDLIFDQALPVKHWGTTYYSTPFSFTTKYTIRILADKNNTSYSIDYGPPAILNAGQFVEINNITTAKCITANQPICVIQYMQGITCAGAGDPAMMYLNSSDQKISEVTFSTVTSTIITQHNVNVILNSNHTGQLQLDGVAVPAAAFTAFPICSNISYAQLSLTQGSHTLTADSGFSAYVYGTGSAESYSYSVGSFSKSQPIQVDSVWCTTDTVHLGTTTSLFGSWWSTIGAPNDTIAIGSVLTLVPPLTPDIYMQHGNEYISGCEKIFYFSVEVPDPPQTLVSSNLNITCQNNQVQLTASTIPASSANLYSWSPVIGLSNPNIANPVLTATTSSWYYVAISTPNGCTPTVYDSIYIEVLPVPVPNVGAGNNQTICLGNSVTLNAVGGVNYSWQPGGLSGNSITVSPIINTNYVVFVTDSNGCQNSDTVMVTVNPVPSAVASNNVTICQGTSTVLLASGGGSYLWTPGGSSANNYPVSPSTSTIYTLQVTNSYGCVDSALVTVNVSPLPIANAGIDKNICVNESATLTATGGNTYSWSPGGSISNTITVSPNTTTNYIVTVIDLNGCVNKDTVSVIVHQLPVVNAGPDKEVCIGDSLILSVVGTNSYVWNPGNLSGNNITVSPIVNTSYSVLVTDSIGCENSDTISVSINPLPIVIAGSNQIICRGDQSTLTATGGTTYLWLPGGSTNSTINVSPILTTNYIVEATDVNGCKNKDTVIINVNQLPLAYAGQNHSICQGASTTLNASGGLNYMWNPGSLNGASITVNPTAPAIYIVEVTDVNGCVNYDTVSVGIYPEPISEFGKYKAVCQNTSFSFVNMSSILHGSITNNYWNFGDGNISLLENPTHIYSSAGLYTVSLVVKSNFGCFDTIAHTLTVNPEPVVDFAANFDCVAIPIQFNDYSTVDPTNIRKWDWAFGDGATSNEQNPTHAYSYSGWFDVALTVTSDSGCTATRIKPQNLLIYPLPVAAFNYTPEHISIMDPVVHFNDQSIGASEWLWSFGPLNSSLTSTVQHPVYVYNDTGLFEISLIVTSMMGCLDTTYKEIYIHPHYTLYFPNAFSPNGDGTNDAFQPSGIGITNFEMVIFDRWGKNIFQTGNITQGWDGTANGGGTCPQGVYVYSARAIDFNSKQYNFTGTVSLIR